MAVNSCKTFDNTTALSGRSEDNLTLEESNLTTTVGKSSAEECVLLSANNKSRSILSVDKNYNVNNNNTNFTATNSSVAIVSNTEYCKRFNLNSQIESTNPNNNIENTSRSSAGVTETNTITINEPVENLETKPNVIETVPCKLQSTNIDLNNEDQQSNTIKNQTDVQDFSSMSPKDSDSEVKVSSGKSISPYNLLNDDSESQVDTNTEATQDESTKDYEEEHEVTDIDKECVEERFRVDRKKMEQLLQAATEGRGQSGDDFFGSIMKSTITEITWPSKLKIGAKSKKDPHIKVTGKEANVAKAKELIMLVLDTKCTRVTLKMDVSHTEHSHVIGKGGNNIKRVMDVTGCHIHFPDSNRNSSADKSNQVSIAGQPAGVESARAKVRELLPIVVMFDLSMSGAIPDPNSPPIQNIVQQYIVSVQFKQRPKVYCTTTCTVRGSNDNIPGLVEGTIKLMQHLTGGSVVPVTSQMEVAPQQHSYMLGRNANNVKMIIQRTGAQIRFPDPNIQPRKSTIFISGSVDVVVNARQKLMGCLPLVLMFDVKQEENITPAEEALKNSQLMESLDIFISVKLKPRQPSKSVIIKSVERNIYNMFEARRQLLKLPSTGLKSPPPSSSPPFTIPSCITPSAAPLIRLTHTPTLKPQYISIIPHNGVTFVNEGISSNPPATPNSPMLRQNWASPVPSPAQSPYPISQQATVAAIHAQQQQQHQLLLQFNAQQQLKGATKSTIQANSVTERSPPSIIHGVKPEFLQYPQFLIANEKQSLHKTEINTVEKEKILLQQQQHRIQQNKEDWSQDQTAIHTKQFYKKDDIIPSNVRGLQKHMLAVHPNFLDGSLSANSSFNTGRTEQKQKFISETTQENTNSRNSFSGSRDINNIYLKVSQSCNVLNDLQNSPPESDRSSPLLERRKIDVFAGSPDNTSKRFKSPSSSSSSSDLQLNLRPVQHTGKYLHPNHSSHLDSKFNDSVSNAYRSATEAQNEADLQELDKYFGKVTTAAPPPGFEAFSTTTLSCSDYVRQKAQEAIKKRPVATEVRTPNNQWVGLGFSQSMPGNEIKKLGKEKYKNQLETAYEDEIYEDDSPVRVNQLTMSQNFANSSKGGSALSSWRERNNYNLSQSLHTSKARELKNFPRRREHLTFDPMLMNHSRPTPPHPNDEPSPSYPSQSNPEPATQDYSRLISNQPLKAALSLLTDNHLGGQSNCVELHDLLIHLNLEKYSDVFTTQEVDLQTFLTLTESDLTELGITAFGPRKKILLSIEELKKNRNVLYSSGLHAAPGGPTSSRPSPSNPQKQNSPPLSRPTEPTKNLLGIFLHNNGMQSPHPSTPPIRVKEGVPHGGLSQRGLVKRGMVSQSGRW